jgi:hypothetical protein
MMSIIRTALASALFVLTMGSAASAPGDATKWISEDSASMMDLGLLKLDLWVSDIAEGLKTMSNNDVEVYHTYSGYSWDDDEIIVAATIYQIKPTLALSEKECQRFLSRVRAYAGVDLETGALNKFNAQSNSRISDLFKHEGFKRLNAPSDLFAKIDQRIVIQCHVMKDDEKSFIPFMLMSGKLLSSTSATTVY